VILNEEGREFRWLPLAAAKKLPLNTPTKILLNAVMERGARASGAMVDASSTANGNANDEASFATREGARVPQ
jgi:hypothetical protein